MAGSPIKRARKKAEAEQVAALLADPMWRLNNLYHIKDEDDGKVIPFRPYPEQQEVFDAVINDGHKKIIIPKARRRGMSTGIDVLMLDQAIRHAGYEAGIVDRNQADASKKLENIIKTSLEHLPDFLANDIKTIKNNDDRLSFQVGGDTTSHLYAATGYRGGNCNFLHVSEWGWIQCEDPKRSEEIQTGAIQAARKGQIIVETTWKGGKNGHLWDYMDQSLTTPEEEKHSRSWRHMFFPWHTDPVYSLESKLTLTTEVEDYFAELEHKLDKTFTIGQKRWYQDEAWPLRNNRFGEYPSTLEECFKAPMEGVIYDVEMARALAERRITTIPLEKGLPVFVSFDLGRNDAMPVCFIQVVGKEIRVVGYYVNHRESVRHYGEIIKAWMAEKEVQDVRILLPHDGGRKSLESGKTLADVFHEMGFHSVQTVPRITSIWAGINYVKDSFEYIYFDKKAMSKHHSRGNKKFPSLGECLDNYHQAQNANGVMVSMEPVHDDYSHGCDALRTFCEAWQRGMISRVASRASEGFDEDFKATGMNSNSTLAGGSKWRQW
tara:strand:- start:525 stop:2171 length:1647 start_codon:yes stop_codon:yes gene_type:complete